MVRRDCKLQIYNFICYILFAVECYPWASYVESIDCLDSSLLLNKWANASELEMLAENEKKKRLVTSLSLRLDPSVHSQQELNQRPLSGSEGGLCGLAALQHGLGHTIASRSQLRTLSYETMRLKITEEMGIPSSPRHSDADLLMHLHDCK